MNSSVSTISFNCPKFYPIVFRIYQYCTEVLVRRNGKRLAQNPQNRIFDFNSPGTRTVRVHMARMALQ